MLNLTHFGLKLVACATNRINWLGQKSVVARCSKSRTFWRDIGLGHAAINNEVLDFQSV